MILATYTFTNVFSPHLSLLFPMRSLGAPNGARLFEAKSKAPRRSLWLRVPSCGQLCDAHGSFMAS